MGRAQKSFKVDINPEVMRWAIESSGWGTEELANRLKIAANTLDAWQSGVSSPTYRQLENLAQSLKRPVTALLLPAPPAESPPPPDFRMLPGRTGSFDKETIFAIRKARRLQQAGRELMENIRVPASPQMDHAPVTSNPAKIAIDIRNQMGVSEDAQKKWKHPHDAFKKLRSAIEERNILVFQMKMPIEDVRGFALVDEMPAVIVVSSSDPIKGRIFTLLHELGHIVLKRSGIDMGGQTYGNRGEGGIEKWCNDFASEFLLPRERFLSLLGPTSQREYDEEKINNISNQFKVSKIMLLTKMRRLNILDQRTYEEIRAEMVSKVKPPKERGGAQPSEARCLNEKGERFVSLVRDNIERGDISYYDAVDLLSVKVNVVGKVLGKSTG